MEEAFKNYEYSCGKYSDKFKDIEKSLKEFIKWYVNYYLLNQFSIAFLLIQQNVHHLL